MNSKPPNGKGLDELLKRALPDDLPADAAAGMRERLARFRERTVRREERTPSRTLLFPRGAWAALSVLILISGGLLQGRGARNPLSDRISLIKTRLAVSGQLAAAEAMSCSARVRRDDGEFVECEIAWRSGSPAEVVVKGPGGSPQERFRLGESPAVPDALSSALASLFTPSAVGARLSGEWQTLGSSRGDGCDTGAYAIPAGAGSEALEFTIDMCTFLPVRISGGDRTDISWEATFRF
jgi:hypothetical protein